MKKPFEGKAVKDARNGFLSFGIAFLIITLSLCVTGKAFAQDGASEALELRYQAELAIAGEKNRELAKAMQEALPGLLQEYLATRDGTIALDAVDASFVEEQFKVARAMEEPGVALALDVYSGPGTGYEHGLRTSIANLAGFHSGKAADAALNAHEKIIDRQLAKLDSAGDRFGAKLDAAADRFSARAERFTQTVETKGASLSVTPGVEVKVETKGATVEVTPGSGPADVTPGNGNAPVARDGTPGNSGGNGKK